MSTAFSYYLLKRIIKGSYILVGCLLFPFFSSAQIRGKVEVIKDPLIDTLIARRPSLGKSGAGGETTNGYRVQLYFGSNRQAAYNAQAKFKQEYPEYPTYIFYTEPNFKVHAGDFRTRLEAEKLQQEVTAMFSSLFIISEPVNPPKADDAND